MAWLLCVFMLVLAAPELRAGTTIYVGKHFEVRDHDAPVKYVFNGQTRVTRVTGSLAANERIQRLRLRAGWNLVSLAVTAPHFLDQLREFTSGPMPVIKALYRWQPATRDYGTIASSEGVPAGTVLWVSAQTNSVVAVRGGYVEPSQWGAPAGETFVAAPALEAHSLTVPPGVTIWRYDAQNRRWQAGLTADLASLSDLPPALAPGEAIYVHSNESTDLGALPPEERIRYYHQDHLGSSSVITDANGAVTEETAFYPFGIPRHEHRVRQIEESYKFTQKERDQESGLHYFEARYLAGTLSRFLSVDPLYANTEASSGDPQALNLYAYAHSSPLQYIDPTGLDDLWIPGVDSLDELDLDRTGQAIGDFLDSTWLGGFIKAPPPLTATHVASLTACFGDTITFGGTRFLREKLGIAPTVVDTSSGACTVGTIAGVLVPLPGPKGGAALTRVEPGTVLLYSGVKSGRGVPAVANSSAPKGPNTVFSESGAAIEAAKHAEAAAAAAARAEWDAYTQIVGAQRESMMRVYQGLGITPNSRMVGDIMKNAIERANAIWRETRGTKPPGG